MKAWIVGAVLGVSLIGAALPASAQVVVGAGGDGVVVREGYRYQHYDRGRHYGWERGRHYGWRNHYASCRTVTVRRYRPNGTVVVTRRREC